MIRASLVGLMTLVLLAACQPQSPGTVARRFVSPPVVVRDASGNGNDGVMEGLPEIGVPGKFGTAYSFREPGSWIRVAPAPELNPGNDNFLISAWLKVDSAPSVGGSMDLIRKGLHGSPGGELKLEIVAGGRVKCTVKDTVHRDASKFGPPKNVADGTWHHVGCARTALRLVAMLDGRLVSKPARTGEVSNTLPLAIGSKYGREDRSGGLLDEVAFYVAPPARAQDGTLLPLKKQITGLRQPRHAVGLWHLDAKNPEAAR